MLYIKIHKSYRTVVAVCDSNLIGKKFEEGIKILDCRKSFYKGESVSYEKAVEIMKFQSNEDATFNIVGKEAVKAAIEAGITEKKCIGKIQNVPYILVLL